jgi:cysteine synthase
MQNQIHKSKIENLAHLIGNTPLIEINVEFDGKERLIYAKAENFNMTGSIKDRMAYNILKNADERGLLKPNSLIIEATSGNTGISFSALGKSLGHRVVIFMPNWLSQERINLIKSFGAEIILISKEEGGFLGSIQRAEELAAKTENSFLPRQFANEDNCEAHYKTTGMEISWQMQFHRLIPDAFIAGVGTGGTIMGTGKFLREKFPNIKIYPLEPANSPTLSTGCKVGKHRIQGISDEFIPPILDLKSLDKVIAVDDGDSIIMAQKLACELGIGVGISSGANLLGALKVQNELGKDSIVVTIFPDDNKKYLSTDLFNSESIKPDSLSRRIKLKSVKAFKRVCQTCLDSTECAECVSEMRHEICMKIMNKPLKNL